MAATELTAPQLRSFPGDAQVFKKLVVVSVVQLSRRLVAISAPARKSARVFPQDGDIDRFICTERSRVQVGHYGKSGDTAKMFSGGLAICPVLYKPWWRWLQIALLPQRAVPQASPPLRLSRSPRNKGNRFADPVSFFTALTASFGDLHLAGLRQRPAVSSDGTMPLRR